MTLFVAICDDDTQIIAQLETTLASILEQLNIKYEIDTYLTGEDLCHKMGNGAFYNLIFLDIELKNDINGVKAGHIIREVHGNEMVSIVYISWEKKYAMELFANRPFNFITKPLDHAKIQTVMEKYVDINNLWVKDFTYKIGHDTYKVQLKSIVYLRSAKDKIVMHLADGKQETFYGTLKNIYQDQLQGHDFLFIHAAYVVNYDHIKVAKYSQVVLAKDGIVLPISQPRRKDIRDEYLTITERRRG